MPLDWGIGSSMLAAGHSMGCSSYWYARPTKGLGEWLSLKGQACHGHLQWSMDMVLLTDAMQLR